VHVSGVFSWTYVFRFNPTNKKSAFIEWTSFKSFDGEVPSFYFGSMSSFAHKPVLHKRPVLHLSKKSSRPPLRPRLYCIYALLMYTNTARSTEGEQRICSKALTSEVGLLQNFRAYKWIPLSWEKKSFLSKESDTKFLQSMYFASEVGIISSYSNRIHM